MAAHSPSSLMRCCLLRRESMSKLKSFHSSRGGKEMVWRRVKRTASITRSPRVSLDPTLTVEAPLGVLRRCGGEEKSCSCLWSRMPFQMACRNCSGIFRLAKSCATGRRPGVRRQTPRLLPRAVFHSLVFWLKWSEFIITNLANKISFLTVFHILCYWEHR